MWAASCEKVPCGLSQCHTKRRTGVYGRLIQWFCIEIGLIFFQKKKSIFFPTREKKKRKILQNRCHTKRRMGATMCTYPSFGMTWTQEIRDLFAGARDISWLYSFSSACESVWNLKAITQLLRYIEPYIWLYHCWGYHVKTLRIPYIVMDYSFYNGFILINVPWKDT